MKKFASYLKAHRNAGYCFLSLILLLLLVATCSLTIIENNFQSHMIDRISLESSIYNGYDIDHKEDGSSVWTPNADDPRIQLSSPLFEINCAKISLNHPLPDKTDVWLYYTENENDLEKQHSSYIQMDEEQTEIAFFIPKGVYNSISISINGEFSPKEICFSRTEITPQRRLNPVPLVILLVFAIFLIVFDRKIGYITHIGKLLTAKIDQIKSFCTDRRWFILTLYLLMCVSTIVYITFLILLLLFSSLTINSIVALFWITVATVVFQLLYRLCANKNAEPAKLFLIITLLIGFMFSCAFPITTGVSWDDQIHYYRTEVMSRFLFGHQRTLADYAQAIVADLSQDSVGQFEDIMHRMIWMDQQKNHLRGHIVNFYGCIAYLHNSCLIFLCDLLSIDFVLQMTLMKMLNVAIYALVIYRGIRKLKSGTYLASAICLMPTAMFLASTINYDFWVICFLIYGFSSLISELQQPEKKLTFRETLHMMLAVFIGCGPKAIYFLLLFPFLFLSKEKFHQAVDYKKHRMLCIILAIVIMLSFMLPFFVRMDLATDERGGTDVNSLEQVKFILSSPFQYIRILVDFLIEYTSLQNAVGSTIFFAYLGGTGGFFASLSVGLILFCAFVDKKECDAFRNAGWFNFITFLSVILDVVLIATALYISFTPVANPTVNGCQWRYLIPLLFPLFYSLGGRCAVRAISDRKMSVIVYGLACVALIGAFHEVYLSSFMI